MAEIFVPAALNAPLCKLGEGPVYDPHTDTVWWFDILQSKLCEYQFQSGVSRQHDLPFPASALARVDAHRQLLFTERGLYLRDVATGDLSLHCEIEADNNLTRSNDARVHPSGAFWLGTMGWQAEQGAGAIYWYFKGELRKLYDNITISNAICFSPDGTVGYFADTALRQVMRVLLDPANGVPVGEPELFLNDFPAGNPDGAVVDADGNFWVALWGGSQIAGYAPDGRFLRSISLPVSQPSCPAFICKTANQMLVTSAWVGLDDVARQQERAGATFIMDLPFQGRFEPDVKII
ncbi:SMP-30/gluconolactonase/LRE family protein [Pseudochrobactrum sp. sp1633]|uniref:SMP-30/gluconolactonase/LRE family protein n=1 Tax=Pseudochrobactrum sp. sp1633 TaxID=3036706 RepID=UPI0025A67371|nr:SMP-30/gluconolactonase/LRE family protein [Pseudochrobactrum sp. sp1633]MDM8345862.1 SMP-30/gluconolactonase/LRE family protein [Pseudochrobactrum sp. sp1633]HWD12280.1 SMP-30/gluconolactonase/LRE family protein [Pseudochrobactrum sp.]